MTRPEPPDLPPTAYLIMEVLGARWRLGENLWTFPTTVRPALRILEDMDLIAWKAGIVEHTCLAWLTDEGKAVWLSPTYQVRPVAG